MEESKGKVTPTELNSSDYVSPATSSSPSGGGEDANVINKLFGLVESVLSRKDYWTSDDVRGQQQQQSPQQSIDDLPEVKPVAIEEETPTVEQAVEVLKEVSNESGDIRADFPSPTPAVEISTTSPTEKFRELYKTSPRRASRYFEENAQEILKGVQFI